jgi:hypothetical protein
MRTVPDETVSTGDDQPALLRDFTEIWRAADKIVYSQTLTSPSSARTRIERDFDPAAIRDILVGGGKRALPDDVHARLELLDEHRFRNGVVHLRYALRA